MPRFECATCALPAADREAVEAKIASRIKYRELAKLCGLSKSALHRHAVGCMPRNRLRELKNRLGPPVAESRAIVFWADDGTLTLDGKPFDGQFLPNDIVLNVVYEQKEIRNPGALIDEALAEDAERFPREEVPESLAEAVAFPDATPCHEIKVAADDIATVEAAPAPCSHKGHAFERDETLPEWHGWYSLRRFHGTQVRQEAGSSDTSAKALGNSKDVFDKHYLKSKGVLPDVRKAVNSGMRGLTN